MLASRSGLSPLNSVNHDSLPQGLLPVDFFYSDFKMYHLFIPQLKFHLVPGLVFRLF